MIIVIDGFHHWAGGLGTSVRKGPETGRTQALAMHREQQPIRAC